MLEKPLWLFDHFTQDTCTNSALPRPSVVHALVMSGLKDLCQKRSDACVSIVSRRRYGLYLILLTVGITYWFSSRLQIRRDDDEQWKLLPLIARLELEQQRELFRYYRLCGHKTVTPKCIQKINADVPFSPTYSDPEAVPRTCWVSNSYRNFAYRSMRYWMELAANGNITWWITSGSFIGALRHHDVIPYDHDVDVAIVGDEEAKVREKADPKETFHAGLNLRVRPGEYDGKRVNCLGYRVLFQIDECSFNGPLARIIQATDYFFDIFSSKEHNGTHFYPEGGEDLGLVRKDSVFPLTLCRFMNLTLPCPRNAVQYLTPHFPKFYIPSKSCLLGQLWL